MMRNLLFVSLLGWFVLNSCASARLGFRMTGERLVEGRELPGIVDSQEGVNKFNLQLDIARNHFSGLLLVKQMGDRHFRTVFTTHFGMRAFDFEFVGDSLSVHYCIEPIHKEKVIRLFQNDFSNILGWLGKTNQVARVYKSKGSGETNIEVYRFEGNLFYRKNLENNRIERIVSGRGWRKTTWIFEDFRKTYPVRVVIQHALWPIRLKLERL